MHMQGCNCGWLHFASYSSGQRPNRPNKDVGSKTCKPGGRVRPRLSKSKSLCTARLGSLTNLFCKSFPVLHILQAGLANFLGLDSACRGIIRGNSLGNGAYFGWLAPISLSLPGRAFCQSIFWLDVLDSISESAGEDWASITAAVKVRTVCIRPVSPLMRVLNVLL